MKDEAEPGLEHERTPVQTSGQSMIARGRVDTQGHQTSDYDTTLQGHTGEATWIGRRVARYDAGSAGWRGIAAWQRKSHY
jgi:hypothetical protein